MAINTFYEGDNDNVTRNGTFNNWTSNQKIDGNCTLSWGNTIKSYGKYVHGLWGQIIFHNNTYTNVPTGVYTTTQLSELITKLNETFPCGNNGTWVAAHLINADFCGEDSKRNLCPLPNDINKFHSSNELIMKILIGSYPNHGFRAIKGVVNRVVFRSHVTINNQVFPNQNIPNGIACSLGIEVLFPNGQIKWVTQNELNDNFDYIIDQNRLNQNQVDILFQLIS